MVKDLESFEEDFFKLLGEYASSKDGMEYDVALTHDLYSLLDGCEEFIKKCNEWKEDE